MVPVSTQSPIPFSPPDITEAEISSVVETMRSGWITTGPKTKEFERRLAAYCGTPRAVCLNSATASLESALRLLGVGPGDEVITSAYTYTASCSVIVHVGATPVLVDVAAGSYQMDIEALAAAITPRTKVIIPVDVAGVMCDYDRILKIATDKAAMFSPANHLQGSYGRIIILADAAHSFGAMHNGRRSGDVADLTAFSFHAVKNLTTAEGGALTWRSHGGVDDEVLYHRLQLLSLHGQSKDALAKNQLGAWEYDIVDTAYKCNMTDIMAAIGLVQLDRYPSMEARRHEVLDAYQAGIVSEDVELIDHFPLAGASSMHLALIRLLGRDEHFRNSLIVKMAQRGVATNVHYKPLPMHSAYRKLGFDIADFPQAFNQYRCEVTLPLYSTLDETQVGRIITAFHESYDECVADGD